MTLIGDGGQWNNTRVRVVRGRLTWIVSRSIWRFLGLSEEDIQSKNKWRRRIREDDH